MANKKLSEGVGKKIVEALKKQSEIEVNPIPAEGNEEFSMEESALDMFTENEPANQEEISLDEDFLSSLSSESDDALNIQEAPEMPQERIDLEQTFTQPIPPVSPAAAPNVAPAFTGYQQQSTPIADNFASDLDTFEIPSNIAVLKKLITQLPSGVTRHTGAQIIRQTMEALGISMKSVLQEAQQVQDGLNNSVKECQSSIQEYKKQIITLEKQSQNHQRQYAALNELISLFVQTGR